MKVNFKPTISHISFRSSLKEETSNVFYNKYKKEYTTPFHRDLQECLNLYLKENKDISAANIKGFAGHGGLSVVFDLGEKGVLKCSKENPLEYRKHNPEFDIPFTSPVIKVNDFYIVQQPKAETLSVTQKDCIDVLTRMSKEGFEPSLDFDKTRTRQVGHYNGKAYLLDTRCALPMPNRFSIEVYNFCARNKRVFHARKIDPSDFGHIEEVPRANLNIKEAKTMIQKIIKDNIKSGFPPLNDGVFGLLKLIIICIKYKFTGVDWVKPNKFKILI